MRRVLTFAVMGVVAVGLAASCAQTSKADVTASKLSIVGEDGKAAVLEIVDLGKTGFGPSDQLIEESPVSDTDGKAIGTAYTAVTMTSGTSMADAVGLIDCHIVLDGGSVLFNGSVSLKDLGTGVTVPVIGGTGRYAGAGGSVTMKAPDDKHTNMDFDLLLPKVSD